MPYLEDYIPVVKYHGLAITNSTATDSGGSATCNTNAGIITTASLATNTYTLTIKNDKIAAADIILANVCSGTNTSTGTVNLSTVTPAAGSVALVMYSGGSVFNGTLKVSFLVVKT